MQVQFTPTGLPVRILLHTGEHAVSSSVALFDNRTAASEVSHTREVLTPGAILTASESCPVWIVGDPGATIRPATPDQTLLFALDRGAPPVHISNARLLGHLRVRDGELVLNACTIELEFFDDSRAARTSSSLSPVAPPPAPPTACPCLLAHPNGVNWLDNNLLEVSVDGGTYAYPGSYGLGCTSHDVMLPSSCDVTNENGTFSAVGNPQWCSDDWCYVDTNACNVASSPTSYFPVTLHWSFEACAAKDMWSEWSAGWQRALSIEGGKVILTRALLRGHANGAIEVSRASLTLIESSIRDNLAQSGAAIIVGMDSEVLIVESNFTENKA
eukprot:1030829-Prymnesium_polylepis.1